MLWIACTETWVWSPHSWNPNTWAVETGESLSQRHPHCIMSLRPAWPASSYNFIQQNVTVTKRSFHKITVILDRVAHTCSLRRLKQEDLCKFKANLWFLFQSVNQQSVLKHISSALWKYYIVSHNGFWCWLLPLNWFFLMHS